LLDGLLILPYDTRVAAPLGRVEGLRPASRHASTRQRHLDRRVLPHPELPLATLNTKDYLDFFEHEGLEQLP
jgi:hypothetical protein